MSNKSANLYQITFRKVRCNSVFIFEELTGSYLFEKMQDLEYLLDVHITLKLVNKAKNEKYLHGKAHISFLFFFCQ